MTRQQNSKTGGCCGACLSPKRPPTVAPTRRGFLVTTLAAVGSVLLLPSPAWAKKVAVSLKAVKALLKVGGSTVVKIKGEEILLIRDTATSVRATTAICSHQQARLGYDAKKKRIVCTNHGSTFDLQGKVVKGPATKGLASVHAAHLDEAKERIVLDLG